MSTRLSYTLATASAGSSEFAIPSRIETAPVLISVSLILSMLLYPGLVHFLPHSQCGGED
jgi:hypothetical protein